MSANESQLPTKGKIPRTFCGPLFPKVYHPASNAAASNAAASNAASDAYFQSVTGEEKKTTLNRRVVRPPSLVLSQEMEKSLRRGRKEFDEFASNSKNLPFSEYDFLCDLDLSLVLNIKKGKLFLGSVDTANNEKLIKIENIETVISLITRDIELLKFSEINYLRFEIRDALYEDLLSILPAALNKIIECINGGKNVLVHCHKGISRSASVVLAFMLYRRHAKASEELTDNMIFQDTYARLHKKRNCVSPNLNFCGQLLTFQKIISERNSEVCAGTLSIEGICALAKYNLAIAKQLQNLKETSAAHENARHTAIPVTPTTE